MRNAIRFSWGENQGFIRPQEFEGLRPSMQAVHTMIREGTGAGADFLGWRDLPAAYDQEEYRRIKEAAKRIQKDCRVFVVVGIGGSYLGARAVIEYLRSPLYNMLPKDTPEIYYAGNCLSASALEEVFRLIGDRDVCINVISKSGTTTEPAVAFRVLRAYMEKRYGEEGAAGRIYVTTDKCRGTLKQFSDKKGYETFVVPDDVGGRFSVLTAVGLLPIAVAGIDIDALMSGAVAGMKLYAAPDYTANDAYRYAMTRRILNAKGKQIEVLVSYEPYGQMLNEWWKQLFGESEGKDHKGIFPASVVFSTDLHSMGQFIQDGSRNLFETVVSVEQADVSFPVADDPQNIDGLNFLSGVEMDRVKATAAKGTLLAHVDGGVPNLSVCVDRRDEYALGQLLYFFEMAVAASGYLSGVNPFDQPGVEAYKKNMFALLGKPGYEDLRAALQTRLDS